MLRPKLYQVTPNYVTNPSATLREVLTELNMTQVELAERMGITRKYVGELLTGKARILPQTAAELAFVLAVPTDFWLTLQLNYDRFAFQQAQADELAKHQQYVANFPYAEMVTSSLVPATTDPVAQLANLMHFFRVASFASLQAHTSQDPLVKHEIPVLAHDQYAVHVWLQAGVLAANRLPTEPFDLTGLMQSLSQLRTLTQATDYHSVLPKLQQLLATVGIALVMVPALSASEVNGVTRWLAPFPQVIIELNPPQTTADFWWLLFHELGHVVLHPRTYFFTLAPLSDDGELARQADHWALNILIPTKVWLKFVKQGHFDMATIESLATDLVIGSAVIVRRLQHEQLL
ncbi:HigA family addiction module antitoxin [Lactiplantibacillus fabifermentans]|uniref:HTH cro/C1-type domain-containing protein n=1 Tax=Lactiplantibacillus fabifermentans T30PCM01 TaxID=1400520 RepID=W6T5I2_9LACO|nr:HigA family addiction module antitoxin [Lactiplantibacillus fabifermentans]ETY73058.1 hypothetical protein LFAB_14450 [Lactiplantibacillus fabifermentans T30PCM01]